MALVSKACFPAPTKCHNCERKKCDEVKKESDPKEEYKRCSNCHLMSYCDKDCQREHWLKVHKHHCRFLSGRVLVKNSKHDASTCTRCRDQGQSSLTQLGSENSPKTICNIEDIIATMKDFLGILFGFHEEGKKCNCSQNFGLDLPFPLGEVSGQYVEIGSTGLDAMLAHTVNILTAMTIKNVKRRSLKNAAIELCKEIIYERSILWYDILVSGVLLVRPKEHLLEKVNSLQTMCGDSKSWWKILMFSVRFVIETDQELTSNFTDCQDTHFENLKLFNDYQQSQLQKQAIVCEQKMWHNFMIWPGLVNGSLAMLLPPETRCQSCFAELSGEVTLSPQELNSKALPCLLFEVGDYGALMACCPAATNPNCRKHCLYKNMILRMNLDQDQLKEYCNESELFAINSRNCHFCLKLSLSSHRCSACLSVQYCSTACQKKDFDFHRSVCSTRAKDKSRRIIGKGKQKDYWKSWSRNNVVLK